jgi:hypothetical protein
MVGDAVRTTWCGCNGYYSVSINAQWSIVNGVGIGESLMPLNVSFVNAFNAVTVLFDATVTDGSFTASTGLFTTTMKRYTQCWAYIQSC